MPQNCSVTDYAFPRFSRDFENRPSFGQVEHSLGRVGEKKARPPRN